MNRTTKISFNNCYDCPFLTCNDGFADHYYTCKKLNICSVLVDGHGANEEDADQQLKDWFKKLCPLESE